MHLNKDFISHKGEKRKSYTMSLKREAIEYAEENLNHDAAKMLNPNEYVNGDKIKRKS